MSSRQPAVARGLGRALAMTDALVAVAAVLMVPARAQAAPTVTEFTDRLTPNSSPSGIAAGRDGNLWFTELGGADRAHHAEAGALTAGPRPALSETGGALVRAEPRPCSEGPA